jgi:hypothetical protein
VQAKEITASDPTFHHGLCFFASVATFLITIIPPYLGEYHASTRGTLLGALLVALLLLLLSLSLSLRVQKPKDNTIHQTDNDDQAHHTKVRVWNTKFHTFSDATSFFDDVGAFNHRVSGNIATASIGMRTMTIALLLSLAACGGHTFASAGRPAAHLHGRHQSTILSGGNGGKVAMMMISMLVTSRKTYGDRGNGSRRLWR